MIEYAAFLAIAAVLFIQGFLFLLIVVPRQDKAAIFLSLPAGIGLSTALLYALNTLAGMKLNAASVWVSAAIMTATLVAIAAMLKRKVPMPNVRLPSSPLSKCLMGIIIAIVIALTIEAIILPVHSYDAFLYHLPVAKETFETGYYPSGISPSILEYEKAYPPLGWFSYSLFYIAAGKESMAIPKILPLIFGLCTLALVYFISRALARTEDESFAAVLLALASYYFSTMLVYENIDVFTGLYFVAAAYFAVNFLKTRENYQLYAAALMLAFSYWTKYVALAGIAAFGISLINKPRFKHLIGAAALALLVMLPHLLRNLLLLGNPLYPSFASVLGGKQIDPWYIENVLYQSTPIPFSQSPMDFFFRYCVILMPFLILWLFSRKSSNEKTLLAIASIFSALWMLFLRSPGMPNTYRFMFGTVMIASALAAPALAKFAKGELSKNEKIILASAALAELALLLISATGFSDIGFGSRSEPLLLIAVLVVCISYMSLKKPVLLKQCAVLLILAIPLGAALFHYSDYYLGTGELGKGIAFSELPAAEWMRQNLNESDKVLTFTERVYLLPVRYYPVDAPDIVAAQFSGLENAVKALKDRGITHLMFEAGNADPDLRVTESYLFKNSAIFQSLGSTHFTKVYSEETGLKVSIYRVN